MKASGICGLVVLLISSFAGFASANGCSGIAPYEPSVANTNTLQSELGLELNPAVATIPPPPIDALDTLVAYGYLTSSEMGLILDTYDNPDSTAFAAFELILKACEAVWKSPYG